MSNEQSATGNSNVQVNVRDSTNIHIEVGGARSATLWLPILRPPVSSRKRRELELLLAPTALTDLIGRDDVWRDCVDWCLYTSEEALSVRCITGRGGAGKTRFALELCHEVRKNKSWDARFVRFERNDAFDLWSGTSSFSNVLLVFDYAPDNAPLLVRMLKQFAKNPPSNPTRRVRVLLLARTATWETGWLSQFRPTDSLEAIEPLASFFNPEEPILLRPLTIAERQQVFEQTYQRAALALMLPTQPLDASIFETERFNHSLEDPLTLMMAAIVGLHNQVPSALSLTRLELAYEIAELLVGARIQTAFPDNPRLALHMTAYATVSGGLTQGQALAALHIESVNNHLGTCQNPHGFVEKLADWLQTEDHLLGAIQPDIVGEAFVLGRKTSNLARPVESVLRAATGELANSLNFLVRAIQDFCLAEVGARSEPLFWLQGLLDKADTADLSVLLKIHEALPRSSVILRPQIISTVRKVLARIESTDEAIGNRVGAADSTRKEMIIFFKTKLSLAQSESGSIAEAHDTALQLVESARAVVLSGGSGFIPNLACVLNVLADAHLKMGELSEALATAEEAVQLYSALHDDRPEAFRRSLAGAYITLANAEMMNGLRSRAIASSQTSAALNAEASRDMLDDSLLAHVRSLHTLSVAQSEGGFSRDALVTSQTAVEIARELAVRNRDAYLMSLTMTLDNLANRQAQMRLTVDALSSSREAVKYLEEVDQRLPLAFRSDLARALVNKANKEAMAGEGANALHTSLRAVRLCEELFQINQDAHLHSLIVALNGLSNMYSNSEQSGLALSTAERAFGLYLGLLRSNRNAYLPEFAGSLNNLASRQDEAGDRLGALETAKEAVSVWRELAGGGQLLFLSGLGMSLSNLANRTGVEFSLQDAVNVAREGVEIRRKLAGLDRDQFLPDLAAALNTLGNRLMESSGLDEALRVCEEAVQIRRELSATNRRAYMRELALSLANLSKVQLKQLQKEKAHSSAIESVSLFRELTGNAELYLADRANSMQSLSDVQASLEMRDLSIESQLCAVQLHRTLVQQNPTAHGRKLALSLHNLTIRYSEAGKDQDALASSYEAVAVGQTVAQHDVTFTALLVDCLHSLALEESQSGLTARAEATSTEAMKICQALSSDSIAGQLYVARSWQNLGMILTKAKNFSRGSDAFRRGAKSLLPHINSKSPRESIELLRVMTVSHLNVADKYQLNRDLYLELQAWRLLKAYSRNER